MDKKDYSFTVKQFLKSLIEHGNHHVTLRIGKHEVHPCARCLGMYVTALACLPVVLAYYMGMFSTDFTISFVLSWLLALPAVADWSTVKAGWRDGSNSWRVATGCLLGAGIVTYVFLLPASWFFRVGTFFMYEVVLGSVVFIVHCREWDVRPLDMLMQQATPQSSVVYGCTPEVSCCCDCCFPDCNLGACIIIPVLMCCCCLPLCCGLPCGKRFLGGDEGKKGDGGGGGKDQGFLASIIGG